VRERSERTKAGGIGGQIAIELLRTRESSSRRAALPRPPLYKESLKARALEALALTGL